MPYAWDFLNQFGYINFGAKLPCRGVPPPPGYALEALRPPAAAAAPSASVEGVSMDAEDLKAFEKLYLYIDVIELQTAFRRADD